jgi:hypothetical protein
MVVDPVVMTFATELPLTIPRSPAEMTCTLAGPPRNFPARQKEPLIMYSPTPDTCKKEPKSIYTKIIRAKVLIMVPYIAEGPYRKLIIRPKENPDRPSILVGRMKPNRVVEG